MAFWIVLNAVAAVRPSFAVSLPVAPFTNQSSEANCATTAISSPVAVKVKELPVAPATTTPLVFHVVTSRCQVEVSAVIVTDAPTSTNECAGETAPLPSALAVTSTPTSAVPS